MSGRLIWAPVVLMGASISQVIYHEIGKAKEIDTSLIQSVLPRPTHIAALAVLCILAYVGRDVMLIILGPAWELSSDLSPLQMIWAAAFLLAIPSRTILRALHLQKLQLAIDIGVVIGIASLGLIPKMPPLQLMIIITIIGVLQNIGLFICGRYSLEIKNKLARLL